jgi:hypothetical protein
MLISRTENGSTSNGSSPQAMATHDQKETSPLNHIAISPRLDTAAGSGAHPPRPTTDRDHAARRQ